MFQTKTATIHLTLSQIAELLKQMSPEDMNTLEELLDKKTSHEVLKRSQDNMKKSFSHDEMLESFT